MASDRASEADTCVDKHLDALGIHVFGRESLGIVGLGVDTELLGGLGDEVAVVEQVAYRYVEVEADLAVEVDALADRGVEHPLILQLLLGGIFVDEFSEFLLGAGVGGQAGDNLVARIGQTHIVVGEPGGVEVEIPVFGSIPRQADVEGGLRGWKCRYSS